LGRKVHPLGFRLGVIRDWQAKWFGGKNYLKFLHEDLKLRGAIQEKYADASISLVEIDRQANKVLITIHTSRPGVVIGRGGQRVDEIRQHLETLIGGKVQLNIQEIRQPELDSYLVARSVAEQIERRIAFRRAMKRAVFRTLESGAKGVRILCSGRLGGTEIARREMRHQGQVPLHKLRADIDYGFTEACTSLGRIGVKVWIYRGDILPEVEAEKVSVEKIQPVDAEAAAEVPKPEPAVAVEPEPAEPIAESVAEPEPEPEPEPVAVAEPEPVAEKAEEKPKKPAKAAKAEKAEEKPKKPAKAAKKAEKAEEKPKKPAKAAAKAEKAEEKPKKPAKAAAKAEKAEEKPKKPAKAAKKAEKAEEKPKKPAKKAAKPKKAKADESAAVESEEKDATT